MRVEKTLEKLLRGESDANIRFEELVICSKRRDFACAFRAAITSSPNPA